MVADTYQGLIGHDAPMMPRAYHVHCGQDAGHGHSGYDASHGYSGYSDYGGLEGYRNEDVTSKVSDPPFTNPKK